LQPNKKLFRAIVKVSKCAMTECAIIGSSKAATQEIVHGAKSKIITPTIVRTGNKQPN